MSDRTVNLELYADLDARRLVSKDGAPVDLPTQTLGDTLLCSVRPMKRNDAGTLTEQPRYPVRTLRASVTLGNFATNPTRNPPPTAGSFKFRRTYIPEGETEATHTDSAAINATDTGAAFATACATVFGVAPAEVSLEAPGCWLFRLADGSELVGVETVANRLDPVSHVRVRSWERFEGEMWHEVRLIQSPLAWNEGGHNRVLPLEPFVEPFQTGRPATSTLPARNEIQILNISADFRGTYVLRQGLRQTAVLGIEDGPTEIAAALEAMFDAATEPRISATVPEAQRVYIEFVGAFAGAPQDPLEVDVNTFEPGVLTFAVPLTRPALASALRKVPFVETILEIEAEIGDPDDLEAPGRMLTLARAPLRIEREEIYGELATVPNVNWLRPYPKDYVAVTADQVLFGTPGFTQAVGNGGSVSFDIDHPLATRDGVLVAMENNAGRRVLGFPGEYSYAFPTDDTITVNFATAPAVNGVVVVFMALGPGAYFQAHTHTQSQIVGLVARFLALESRVGAIEDLVPGLQLTTPEEGGATQEIPLPDREEVYPGRFPTLPDLKSKTLRPGGLLPAIHDATAADITAELPDPAGRAGELFRNNTGLPILLPGGLGRRGSTLEAGGYAGCDGRVFYRVTRNNATNSYFPADFVRELWLLPVNDRMLRAGKRLIVEGEFKTQTLVATSRVQCVFVIEYGTLSSQSSPSPTAENLEAITWATTTPILRQKLTIGDVPVPLKYGCRIARDTDNAITAAASLYGALETTDAAPGSANFLLRCRCFVDFDTENNVPDARGLIYYSSTGRATIS